MAEEVRVSAPGPNGNGFQLDLREKKLGLTGPNVALLMLILIIGAVAYIRTGTIDRTLKAGQEQLAATETRVQGRVGELFGRIDKLLDDLQAQNVFLTANNAKVTAGQQELRAHLDDALAKQTALVHTQTEAIANLLLKQNEYVEKWFSDMGTRLEWLDHNIAHPDRRMPLRAPSTYEDQAPERKRDR
jgi:hypothetical protein